MELELSLQEAISKADERRFVESLQECMKRRGARELLITQSVFELNRDEFGDYEFKAAAAVCLPFWGIEGLDALLESALRKRDYDCVTIAITVLGSLAVGGTVEIFGTRMIHPSTDHFLRYCVELHPELPSEARERLRTLVLGIEDEELVVSAVSSGIEKLGFLQPEAAKQVFAALAARWLTVSIPVLNEYESLISGSPTDESEFQAFFERYPQLLDPMTHQLWSRPNLHGYKEPDFIIRRTDDSYMVVEIETPAKPIMTKQGNLSAYATQAIGQVLAYRSFLIDRSHALKHHLPRFTVPDCLVVIGLETVLDAKQAAALAVENEARHAVRIVGFDWLRARANAIVNNVIAHGTTAERIRIV